MKSKRALKNYISVEIKCVLKWPHGKTQFIIELGAFKAKLYST